MSIPSADDEVPVHPVPIDGRRVGVRRFGTLGGWPVVWNHGGLSCALDGKLIDTAARRCGAEIVAIDRPGIGHSDAWTMASITQWPRTVEQVADLLHLDDFAVAGWSGGGPYALACAAALPQRVRAVALIESIPEILRLRDVFELTFWEDELLIPLAHWAPMLAAAPLRVLRHAPDWLIHRGIADAAGTNDRAALKPVLPLFVKIAREATRDGVSGMVDEYRRYYGPWGFDLGTIRQPVTIWQGAEDTVIPTECARRLQGLLPNSTLHVLPETGHLLPLVAADRILQELTP